MNDGDQGHRAILHLLKHNPRGMSLKQISDAMGMNRITVARYLDVLKTSGRVEMEPYGQAKVYYLSNRIPISAMLDFTSSHIIVIDSRKRIINANKPFLNLFNLKEKAIRGKNISDILETEDDENILTKISEALSGIDISEEICIKNNEHEICFWMKIIPTVFYNGRPGLTILLEDITERKKHEEIMAVQKELGWKLSAARTFEEALPLAVNTAIYTLEMDAGAIYLIDDKTRELKLFFSEGLSEEFLENYSIIKQDSVICGIIRKTGSSYLNEREFEILSESDRDHLKKEGIRSVAIIPIRYNGELIASFHIASKKRTEFSEWIIGETEAQASLTANVITRIKAIIDLKNSEKHYRMLFNHANDMIIVNNIGENETDGRVIDANEMACKKLGYENEEFLNLTIYDIDKNLEQKKINPEKEILINQGYINAKRALTDKNGTEIPADVTSHIIPMNNSGVMLSIIKDLREINDQDQNT